LSCLFFEGDRNIAQSVQLPSGTSVFVFQTYKDKLFGGRPVIRLGLDETETIYQKTESSNIIYIIFGVISMIGIAGIVYFVVKFPRNKESKSGDILKTAIII